MVRFRNRFNCYTGNWLCISNFGLHYRDT